MQVHAANKPIDRSNNDQVLRRIAELAVGYSGAELANLLNEAAILAVSQHRRNLRSMITLLCTHMSLLYVLHQCHSYASLLSVES